MPGGFIAWVLALAAVLPLHAQAAEVRWRARALQIVANEKPLQDFLREVVASQGITAVIDAKVAGVVSGKFNMQAQTILDSICATYGFTWYYDGAFIYIDAAGDARSEVLSISAGSSPRILSTLARLKIADNRFPVVINEAEGTLYVSGPKRYVDLVRQAVKLADQRAALTDHAEVRIFPLKYAWAGDTRVNRAGKEVVLPGVTTVLRKLFSRGPISAGPGGAGVSKTSPPMRMGPTREIRLGSGETVNAPKVDMGGTAGAPDDDGNTAAFTSGSELPQFHTDTRMNAVLVRDVPERMAQYAHLIDNMDARPRLIEIEVTIMDISSDNLETLGVDWRLHGRRADAQVGRGAREDTPPLTWGGSSVPPLGGILTASIGNELRNFLLARVSALSKKGTANFVARPKVLTLNNTEAALENMSEIHVKVQGFQDAGLFSITTGTALRVTPLIVDEQAGRGVMLSINIEDGDLSPLDGIDNIPLVRRRTVNTQAMVDENTSLLIAGFSTQETVNASTGVPLLSDVPLVGNLFKYSEKSRKNMERFYLLTPRLVIPGANLLKNGD